MKLQLANLACFGGPRLFETTLPVGQINMPEWDRFEKAATGVFDRKYYSNHGVLAQEFEERLCQLLGARHALTVTNATIGLSLACKALGLEPGDKVIVPGFTFAATVLALTWAGLEPVFCDIDPVTHTVSIESVTSLLGIPGVKAILPVNLWGNACNIQALESLAQQSNVQLFFDSAHAIGCTHQRQPFGGFGDCEVFSFHATKVLSATEGGCITTNDDALAERIRNLRSNYGRRENVPIPVNANGRFSEMQAAFALLSLEDFPENCAANKIRLELYVEELKDVQGLRFVMPTPDERHNYQYIVLEIDKKEFGLCRDDLVRVLDAENILARRYFAPGMHRSVPYKTELPQYINALPMTDLLCKKVLQLPSGQRVSDSDIMSICTLIRFVQSNAKEIKETLDLWL